MPVEFTDDIAAQACEIAADGKSLEAIAREIGVSVKTLSRWRDRHPLFGRSLDIARELGMDVLVERMPDIALDPSIGPQRARVWCDAIKFRAERAYRKKYGASIDMTVTQVDVGGTLIEARKRTVLPGCDLTQIPEAQATDYVMIDAPRTTDTQTVATPSKPIVDPFG